MKILFRLQLIIVSIILCQLFSPMVYSKDEIVRNNKPQNNPVYKKMQNSKISAYKGRLQKMGFNIYQSELLSSLGYDDTTITNLKKNYNIDLLKAVKTAGPRNLNTLALTSDCIVIGTVKKVEPTGWDSWFQTTAYVQVDEYLLNDYKLPKNQIPIEISSTPTRRVIGEETLKVGEHVLLFLNASSLINFAFDNHEINFYNKLVNDSTVRFELLGKYNIGTNNMAIRHKNNDKLNLSEIREKINSVLVKAYRIKLNK